MKSRLLSYFHLFVLCELSEFLLLIVGVILVEVLDQKSELLQVLFGSLVLPEVQKLFEASFEVIYSF